jgi:hypothetical protein
MTRTRTSARKAGTRFERHIADCLAHHIDDRIDRRAKTGAKDKGDIAGWRHAGLRIVAELKDTTRLSIGDWVHEADVERGNDDADLAVVIHKRRGHGHPLDQYVTTTLRDLVTLLTGTRPEEDQ